MATQTVMGRETGRLFNRGARSDGMVQKIDYEGLMKWQMAWVDQLVDHLLTQRRYLAPAWIPPNTRDSWQMEGTRLIIFAIFQFLEMCTTRTYGLVAAP